MKEKGYLKLLLSLLISFIIMYAVMFLNVDEANHIYLSATRTYMALLMVSPMAILMILNMRMVFTNMMLNIIIMAGGIMVFCFSLLFLRSQTLVSDVQYMKGMIPHHSSAIMTSRHADIKDPEVKKLSEQIIESQEREIEQMKKALERLEKK